MIYDIPVLILCRNGGITLLYNSIPKPEIPKLMCSKQDIAVLDDPRG
jgi:hypothetical protein